MGPFTTPGVLAIAGVVVLSSVVESARSRTAHAGRIWTGPVARRRMGPCTTLGILALASVAVLPSVVEGARSRAAHARETSTGLVASGGMEPCITLRILVYASATDQSLSLDGATLIRAYPSLFRAYRLHRWMQYCTMTAIWACSSERIPVQLHTTRLGDLG